MVARLPNAGMNPMPNNYDFVSRIQVLIPVSKETAGLSLHARDRKNCRIERHNLHSIFPTIRCRDQNRSLDVGERLWKVYGVYLQTELDDLANSEQLCTDIPSRTRKFTVTFLKETFS